MTRKARRKGIEDCFHYLGEVGALAFFSYAALMPEADGKTLLNWTLRLQDALLAQKDRFAVKHDSQAWGATMHRLKIDKPQISLWRRANPFQWALPQTRSEIDLDIRVLSVEVNQLTEGAQGWKGHLLLIGEPRTNTLIHHFLTVRRSADVSAASILFALTKASNAIAARAVAARIEVDKVSIGLPDLSDQNSPFTTAYAAAADRLIKALSEGGLTVTWLRNKQVSWNLPGGYVETAYERNALADLAFPTARSFKNALVRTARDFKIETTGTDTTANAAWIALNPLQGEVDRKPGWANVEHERKREALAKAG